MSAERRWITIPEVAAYLGIAVKSAYDMAASGRLPSVKVGRLVRIDLRALDAELERQSNGDRSSASFLAR